MRRVLVTGVGLVTPLGVGVEVNWRRLLRGENAVRRLASLDGMPAQIAAIVPRGDAEHEFSPMRSALSLPGDESSLSHFVQFALAASAEALAHAGWSPQTREQQERTGVAIGSGIGGLSDIIEASDALRERGVRRVSPYFIPKMLVNMAAGQVSIRAGLRGPSAAPATACATGAHALADGLRMIRSGEADVVVAGGAEACVEPLAVAGFSRVRALATSFNDAPERASRPFDASREGFVIGEGAAVLILEEEEHARARGAKGLAELRAVGLSSDAHHITSPPPDGSGALRAMEVALRMGNARRPILSHVPDLVVHGASSEAAPLPSAQVTPSQLDYINAHATSTPSGDAAEALAIDAIARNRPDAISRLLVSSTKGATGHLLGAAGAAEAAFTVLAIAEGRVPPTLNLLQPEPAGLAFEHVMPHETGPLGRMCLPGLRAALCNSFGFGGMNASVLFTKPRMEWTIGRRGELGG